MVDHGSVSRRPENRFHRVNWAIFIQFSMNWSWNTEPLILSWFNKSSFRNMKFFSNYPNFRKIRDFQGSVKNNGELELVWICRNLFGKTGLFGVEPSSAFLFFKSSDWTRTQLLSNTRHFLSMTHHYWDSLNLGLGIRLGYILYLYVRVLSVLGDLNLTWWRCLTSSSKWFWMISNQTWFNRNSSPSSRGQFLPVYSQHTINLYRCITWTWPYLYQIKVNLIGTDWSWLIWSCPMDDHVIDKWSHDTMMSDGPVDDRSLWKALTE